MLTAGATKLRDGVDEALVEVGGPAEAGLGVGGEDEAGVGGGALTVGGVDVFLGEQGGGVAGLNQPGKHRGEGEGEKKRSCKLQID